MKKLLIASLLAISCTCVAAGLCACDLFSSSDGWEYELSSDGTYYTVVGTGTCTETEIVIPSTYKNLPVKSIGSGAFAECTSLTSVTIESGITSIGENAFWYCLSLANITLPDTLTSIGSDAFYETVYFNDSSNWEDGALYIGQYLVDFGFGSDGSLSVRSGTTVIADSAFYNTGLSSITIPSSVTIIGNGAFDSCSSLKSITVDNKNTVYQSIDGDLYSKDGTQLIQYAVGKTATSFTIADSVTSIGSWAFASCSKLTSITIPKSVTSIEDYALYSCTSLKNISVDNDNTAYQSINGNLYSKDGTQLIQYAIGGTATLFTIPDGVTSIGNNAFYRCTSLIYITIPEGVTSIGEDAFSHCRNIVSVAGLDSVTSIGNYAFTDCYSLKVIMLGSSVTNIGKCAFQYCTSLEDVTFANTSGWYVTTTEGATKGTDLADVSIAAKYLRSTYVDYYWYCS